MSHGHAPPPAVPADLEIPEIEAQDLPDWRTAQPGQLLQFADGEQAVALAVAPAALGAAPALTLVRVGWPTGAVLPLGETLALPPSAADEKAPMRLLGAWFSPRAPLTAERVVLEAVRRGLITPRTCGVPWPLIPIMQLTEQAADRIETYLFEVARSTGCAFPFHDIAQAIRGMHLSPRADNPALCDILSTDELSRHTRPADADLLGFWARELRRRIHMSDWVPPPL